MDRNKKDFIEEKKNGMLISRSANGKDDFYIIDYEFDALYDLKYTNRLIKEVSNGIRMFLDRMNKKIGSVIVFGLGNYGMVADSLGIKCCNKIITKLNDKVKIYSFKTGIEFYTGIETIRTIKAVSKEVKPDVVILIDSFVASVEERLGKSIQITMQGLLPGGGLGRKGSKINENTLGVPVISLGVPVIIESKTICGKNNRTKQMVLTLKDIDDVIDKTSKIIAYAINICFTDLSLSDIKKVFE